METILKWLNKPKADDKSLLARFFHADKALAQVANELDSFDGRTEPERCSRLVTRLRQGQDKVLAITDLIIDELLGAEREPRSFRAKFPEEVLQENLAGQLWFGAECLAAGSSIMNREQESKEMRPLAEAVTRSLNNVRHLLRDQCLRNNVPNSERLQLDKNDPATEQLCESLKIFDRLFAEFEWRYVSAMVQVKSKDEYETQELICVLCSETLQRALKLGLLEQDQVDTLDPALMFSIPRLAIVAGLIIYPDGPLNMNKPAEQLSEMFRPFRSILIKVREFLWVLNEKELQHLERLLCTNENISLNDSLKSSNESDNNNISGNSDNNGSVQINQMNRLSEMSSSSLASSISGSKSLDNECNVDDKLRISKRSPKRKTFRSVESSSPAPSTSSSSINSNSISSVDNDDLDNVNEVDDDVNNGIHSHYTTPLTTPTSMSTPKESESSVASSSSSSSSSTSSNILSDNVPQTIPSTSLFLLTGVDVDIDHSDSVHINCGKWLNTEGRRKKSKFFNKNENNIQSSTDEYDHDSNDCKCDDVGHDDNENYHCVDEKDEDEDENEDYDDEDGDVSNQIDEDDNDDSGSSNNVVHIENQCQIKQYNSDGDSNDNDVEDVQEDEELLEEEEEQQEEKDEDDYEDEDEDEDEVEVEEDEDEEEEDYDDDSNLRELDYVVEQIKNLEISTGISNVPGSISTISEAGTNSDNLLQPNILLDCDRAFVMDDFYVATGNIINSDNAFNLDEMPTTSAMAFQKSDSHACSSVSTQSPVINAGEIDTSNSIKEDVGNGLRHIRSSDSSEDSYDITRAKAKSHQYHYESAIDDVDTPMIRSWRTNEQHECHDQCSAKVLAYGKQYAQASNRNHRHHMYNYQHHHHYHSHSNSQQRRWEHYNCRHIKCKQNYTSHHEQHSGNGEDYSAHRYHCHNHSHKHYYYHKHDQRKCYQQQQQLQQQQQQQSPQAYRCHNHHRRHHHHIHYHHTCSSKPNDKHSLECKKCIDRRGISSSTSAATSVSCTSRKTHNSGRCNRNNCSQNYNVTFDSILMENDEMVAALDLNINSPNTIRSTLETDAGTVTEPIITATTTSSTDNNDKDDLNDVNRIIFKNAARLKLKHTDILLHRLFVCIAGVADQLQTNFAFDLRQILRSVFLMNMTPANDDDDNDGNGNAINITRKSKESELFEFRASENDVVQQESNGSSQSIYSAEEVNPDSADGRHTGIYNNLNENVATISHINATTLTMSNGERSSNIPNVTIAMTTANSANSMTPVYYNGSSHTSTSDVIRKYDESRKLESSHNVEVNDVNCMKDVDQPAHHDINNSNGIHYNDVNRKCNSYHSTDNTTPSSSSSGSSSSSSPSLSSMNNSPIYDRSINVLRRSSTSNAHAHSTSTTGTIATTATTTLCSPIVSSTIVTATEVAATSLRVVLQQQQQQQQHQQHQHQHQQRQQQGYLKPPAWIPDQKAPRCMSCNIPFTAFRRRHHCRNCGKVFCGVCSNTSAPLPKYGLTKAVRVCRSCYIYEVNTSDDMTIFNNHNQPVNNNTINNNVISNGGHNNNGNSNNNNNSNHHHHHLGTTGPHN